MNLVTLRSCGLWKRFGYAAGPGMLHTHQRFLDCLGLKKSKPSRTWRSKKTLLWNFQGTLSWLRLWLQSDNTVKEIRNTYTARALCTLLHQQVFRVTTEAHLQKGHTHEDVDAVFSLCSACLRSAHDVQTPRDIQRRIKEKVGPVFQSKGMQFSIDLVGEVPRSIFQETLWTNLGWSFGLWRSRTPTGSESCRTMMRCRFPSHIISPSCRDQDYYFWV